MCTVLYAEYVEKLAVSLYNDYLSIAACKTQLHYSAHIMLSCHIERGPFLQCVVVANVNDFLPL